MLPNLDDDALLPPLPESMRTLWPHQEAPVRRITEMFQAGARMVVLDAPPGCGKSLMAESVRRRLKVQALYLTQTKQLQAQVCVAPDTRILTADLRWVRAGDIVEGDSVFGFDEKPSSGAHRKWRHSVVEGVQMLRLPSYRLFLEDGSEVTCSADHQWLTGSFKDSGALRNSAAWVATERLRTCDQDGKYASKIMRLFKPWDVRQDWDAGYLSGIFDGEGHLCQTRRRDSDYFVFQLLFSQVDNEVLAEATAVLTRLGYRWVIAWSREGSRYQRLAQVRIRGREDGVRLLGEVRPRRLLGKFNVDLLGDASPLGGVAVLRKEFVGEQSVVAIRTTTGTYVAEGLASHNCRTFPYARLIKGRDNYPTFDDPYRTAKDCDTWRKKCVAKPPRGCRVSREGPPHCSLCHPMNACAYSLAKSAALWSPLAVANTSYAFLEWGAQGQFKDYPLVILDEWELVEDVLFNTLNVQVTPRELNRFKLAFPDRPVDEGWVREAAKAVGEVYSQSADNPPDDWPRIGELAIGLRRAAEGLKDRSWIVLAQDPLTGVSIGPIEVGKLGQQYLWPHGKRWLLMSGTAIDIRLRLSKLGWTDFGSKGQPGKGRILQVPSVYPVANRPVRVWPVASMVRDKREASIPKMIVAIEKILDAHPDERVLIHSGTYDIAAALTAGLQRYATRLVTFTKARDRQEAMDRYLARERSVLIGPAMERGVDMPDEACRVVVITRVPYPFQGDPRVRERSKQGGPWYCLQAIETIAALIQMTGRGMRHVDDHAVSYILDSQFLKIRTNKLYTNRWPKWWADSLVDFNGWP